MLPIAGRTTTLAGIALLALVPMLPWLPTLAVIPDGVASAASLQGYATPVAYRIVLIWAAIVVLAAVRCARGAGMEPPSADGAEGAGGRRWGIPLVTILALLALLAYLPPALARTGPFAEDSLMLAVLHRMAHGQVPYLDFEFLYGPLLVYPAHWWLSLTGYSMAGYYWWYAALQAVGLAIILWLVLRWVPRRNQWWSFALLVPFFLDTLLGINWFGVRRLLPLLLLVHAARDNGSWRRSVTGGVWGGLLLAYSHDYAVAALLAVAVGSAVLALRERSWRHMHRGAALAAVAVATWGTVTLLVLGGEGFAGYVATSRELVSRFSVGEAGFAFHWTANALAMFGLLALALSTLGAALPRWRQAPWGAGDRLFLMAIVYALVLLKAGLNRSDIYHLDPPFLALVFGVLLLPPAGVFAWSRTTKRAALLLVAVAAGTSLLANLPSGSDLARGLAQGTAGWLRQRPTGGGAETVSRTVALLAEQQDPDPQVVSLAAYLAAPAQAERPVYFYAATYGLPPVLGVVKQHYINDDFMYSDARGAAERAWLAAHPDALIVITASQWERLLDPKSSHPSSEYAEYLHPTPAKRLIDRLASSHLRNVPFELVAREQRWRETLGFHVARQYREAARFGRLLVLIPAREFTASRTP